MEWNMIGQGQLIWHTRPCCSFSSASHQQKVLFLSGPALNQTVMKDGWAMMWCKGLLQCTMGISNLDFSHLSNVHTPKLLCLLAGYWKWNGPHWRLSQRNSQHLVVPNRNMDTIELDCCARAKAAMRVGWNIEMCYLKIIKTNLVVGCF